MLSLAELVKWTGLAVFELWLHAVGLLVFTLVLTLKLSGWLALSYWAVFLPLFAACALDAYFLFICFIRSLTAEKEVRHGPSLTLLNLLRLGMLATFEILLCYKMDGDLEQGQVAVKSSYGVVFLPVWSLMIMLLFQACKIV